MKRYPSALAAKCPLLWKPYFFSLILIFYYTRKKHFSKGKSPLPNECLPPFTAHIHVYKFFYSITCILVPDNCKTGNPLINYYLHNTTISPTHMFRFSIIPTSFYRSLCSSPSPAFQSAQTGKTSHKYMSLHGCHQVPWGVRQLHQSYEYSEKQALLNSTQLPCCSLCDPPTIPCCTGHCVLAGFHRKTASQSMSSFLCFDKQEPFPINVPL